MARADDILEQAAWRPTARTVGWLTVALTLVVVPHLTRVPWVGAAFLVVAGWRWWTLYRGGWTPGPVLTSMLAGAGVIGVALQFGTLLGRDAGVMLLTVLAAMKLLETRSARDAYVAVFLAFFLIITNFLYSQSIAVGVYMVVVTVVTVAAMVSIQHPGTGASGAKFSGVDASAGGLTVRAHLTIASALVMQALPVMVVLFVLFPRVPGPLWGLPDDAYGTSGLSETMAPGDISNLSLTNTVAFRVAFSGDIPPANQMYWRGPVLEATDGRTWSRRHGHASVAMSDLSQSMGREVEYEVTLEPTQKRWLFALEMPQFIDRPVVLNNVGELRVAKPVRERVRYAVLSSLDFALVEPFTDLQAALQLRKGFHLRSRRLAASWAQGGVSAGVIVNRALTYFRNEPFTYTLRPQRTPGDSVDEFLFLTREGFCEHFASAFTVLMRAAGVPARVVTGYQGGEWNEVGGYWIVRNRDAHAWSEVWLLGRGWVRVDPTAAVSPARVERGMDIAMPASAGDAFLGLAPGAPGTRLWRRIRLGWDSANDSWNQWVLSYGPTSQRRFLSALGLNANDWRQIG
ncbi:MAG: DUF3488 domain-containing transglutaminase family protein, partial [Chromatiales bacterium]|nr:DUF3488 domain-containing transglutaminase family protein [Chromatiales bacterium]